jgi:hypothetical protein
MLKRGQSEILITVILILVVIAAIVTVGVFIKNSITKGAQESETRLQIQTMNLKFDIKSAYINRSDNRTLFVSVFRESGSQENIDSLKFIAFDKSGESYDYIDKIIAPGHKALETKVYTITAVNLGISSLENITRVWIYYGLNSSSGSFVFSNLLDEYGYNTITKEGDIDENFGDLTFAVAPCTPLIQNGSWSNWTNLSCLTSNLMNQSRTLIQYDVNGCGVNNISFYEYRQTESCIYEIFNVQNSLYVREGATGSNNGSDWNNAYTNLPATLIRGFTYYFADGSYEKLSLDDAPSAGKYIVLKKATSNDHGTNIGWQANYGDGSANFSSMTLLTSNIIIDGITGSLKSGYGFRIPKPDCASRTTDFFPIWINPDYLIGNVTIKHLQVDNCGSGYGICGYSVYGVRGPFYNITIANNYIHGGSNNFKISYWENSVIENNFIGDQWSSSANPYCHGEQFSPNACINITLRNNIFEESTHYIVGGQRGNVKASNGTVSSFTDSSLTDNRANWQNNQWENDIVDVLVGNNKERYAIISNTQNTLVVAPALLISEGTVIGANYTIYNAAKSNSNWKIYNNIVIDSGQLNTVFGTSNADLPNVFVDSEIYGNTLLNMNGLTSGIVKLGRISPVYSGTTKVYNNLIYNSTNPTLSQDTIHNYNSFFDCKGMLPDELNIQTDSGDPFVDWKNYDFRLKSPSFIGINLPVPYNTDFAGNIRGGDGLWDRGAYEYS